MSTQKSKQREIWFGYDIHTADGSIMKPKTVRFWSRKNPAQTMTDVSPHYGSDALLGLAFLLLNQSLEQTPETLPEGLSADPQLTDAVWRHLEPHYELYERAQSRLKPLQKGDKHADAAAAFEARFEEQLRSACQPSQFDFTCLPDLIEAIDDLETATKRPLLFNMNLAFSKEGLWRLHFLYSLLFHSRAQIAGEVNKNTRDLTHQGLKVDSISDYLPKSEYVANDALLYWEFKKLKPELGEKGSKAMEKAFWSYAHNGACLIESLPKAFLTGASSEELEKALYLAQMDWLLGTPAALLFIIREEIYGIAEGYNKVFWPDHEPARSRSAQIITVQCHLNEKKVFQDSEVA